MEWMTNRGGAAALFVERRQEGGTGERPGINECKECGGLQVFSRCARVSRKQGEHTRVVDVFTRSTCFVFFPRFLIDKKGQDGLPRQTEPVL